MTDEEAEGYIKKLRMGAKQSEAGLAAPPGSASVSGVVQIPANHNVTGTCGACGGPIISPMLWGGTCPPSEWCMNCGKHPKPIVAPSFGPVREMTPNVALRHGEKET